MTYVLWTHDDEGNHIHYLGEDATTYCWVYADDTEQPTEFDSYDEANALADQLTEQRKGAWEAPRVRVAAVNK